MNKRTWGSCFFPAALVGLYGFLYLPLVLLVLFSFNDNQYRFEWEQFTTKWYGMIFETPEIWDALCNSLIVASSAVVLTVSMSVLFIFFGSSLWVRRLLPLFYLNLAIPEIVLAVGLVTLFYFLIVPLSLATLIAAHTVLGLGYVLPIIYDRYSELDKKYQEASSDLGASQWQTFSLVVLPLLAPALYSSSLLVFIISFDDFILSFFCAGGATQTLPMYIFAVLRAGSSPVISALSSLLLMVSSILVLLFLWLNDARVKDVR